MSVPELNDVKDITQRLFRYCESNQWAGYDPYDALNSRLFQIVPLLNSKLPRLVLTQTLKRSPVNLRPLLLVPKTENAKGLALFLSAMVKLARAGLLENKVVLEQLADKLLGWRIRGAAYSCWGYSFDWQTRTELVPKETPNIICTTFAANALLDLHGWNGDARLLEAAKSAAAFIREVLYVSEGGEDWFNYTPLEQTQIHNANLLGAALLCRVAQPGANKGLLEPALKAARFSVKRQNQDGSWYYGERKQPSQEWVDNFHTGFNLCALADVAQFADTREFNPSLSLGLEYYVANFFEPSGAPKYFNDQTYPIDIHSAAQSVITLLALKDLRPGNVELAMRVLKWTVDNLWNADGYFYYQRHRYWTNRIPYMRWGQAWMLNALAATLCASANVACKADCGAEADRAVAQ